MPAPAMRAVSVDAKVLAAYSQAVELCYIEQGTNNGVKGYWFADRKLKRVFVTEQDICSRLDRRKSSMFSPVAG